MRLTPKQKEIIKELKNGNELFYSSNSNSFFIKYANIGACSKLQVSIFSKLLSCGLIEACGYGDGKKYFKLTTSGQNII